MICEFTTTPDGDKYRHECRLCGIVRVTPTEKLVRECEAARPPRTEKEQADCLRRCAGCEHWKITRCGKCTCPKTDPIAWARRLERGQCPLHLWPAS